MRRLLCAVPVLLLLCGCAGSQPYRTEKRLQRGLVIVLPGIEGRGGISEAICRGLDKGGVNWAIELTDWTNPLGLLYNLRAHDENRRKASQIAWQIRQYHWNYPQRPVVLIGQSGGGAMAVWTAEAMYAGQQLDGIILLAASISPDYVLDFALEKTRRGIVNFHSVRDWVLLGLGTTVYGTMDGAHSASAGQIGFEVPRDLNGTGSCYRKLFQVPWRQEMAKAGHSGMHLTSGAEGYVTKYVAPFILTAFWDDELAECIARGEWTAGEQRERATTRASAPERRVAIRTPGKYHRSGFASTQPTTAPAERRAKPAPLTDWRGWVETSGRFRR